MDSIPTASECSNCGSPSGDAYCSTCGQRVADLHVPIRDVIVEFVSEALSVDGPLVQTVRGLLRPGYLTQEFVAGRRVRYVSPVRLYLVTSVLFAAALAFADSSFAVDMEGSQLPRSTWMQSWGWSVLVVMPLFAAMTRVIRRPRGYFIDHLVFSIHLHAAGFVLIAICLPIIEVSPSAPLDLSLFLAIPAIWLVYLFLATRSYFDVSTGRALVATLLLGIGYGLLQLGTLAASAFVAYAVA